jgi:hypothetical protein
VTDAVLDATGTGLGERPVDPASVHIGLDIGGTKVLGVALGADDVVLADVRMSSEPGPEKVVDIAAAAARQLADRVGTPLSALAGIGQLRIAVANGLSQRSRTPPFLASLDRPGQVMLAPREHPIEALGAALLAPGREPAL